MPTTLNGSSQNGSQSQSFLLPIFQMKIDGSLASQELMDSIVDVMVENSLHLPDVCTVQIYDANFKWVDSSDLAVGKRVEMLAGFDTAVETIFDGEITVQEMDMNAQGVPMFVLRCYNRAHRLHRGRHRRSFVQSTDSDIVSKVAGEAGLTASVDATSIVHQWVFQNNQTNWEFLSERAARNGYRLYVEGQQTLCFRKVKSQGDDEVTYEWGVDLRSFRPRLSASPQVNSVTVRGWNYETKQAIVGQANTAVTNPLIGESRTGGAMAQAAFSSQAQMIVVDRPVHSQAEAEAMAKSILDDISGEFIEADGVGMGNSQLLPGKMVQIKGVGTRFSGKYFVTSTTHVYSPSEGYTTMFSVSGKNAGTMLSLLEHDNAGKRSHLGGNIVVALVTNNKDEKNWGRVKVKFPWLTDEHESDWVRIAAPMAGPNRGFYFLPEINDEVLVAFEHGDMRRPYIVGALWNGIDAPVEPNNTAVKQDSKVQHRVIKTRVGHTIMLDDGTEQPAAKTGEVKVTTKYGHVLTLNDDDKHITLKTTNGHQVVLHDTDKHITLKTMLGHKVLLDDAGKKIEIVDFTGANKIVINSNSGAMNLECVGNFTVDAKGKVSIQGLAGVDVKTPAMMNLESNSMTTVKTTGIMTIQGTLVKIN
jgi:phage protein D